MFLNIMVWCYILFFLYILFDKSGLPLTCLFFFFNDTATTEIYTLSLHDALPIFPRAIDLDVTGGELSQHLSEMGAQALVEALALFQTNGLEPHPQEHARATYAPKLTRDRKSTRLNSSHDQISYAVFCLKKKTYTQVIIRVFRFDSIHLNRRRSSGMNTDIDLDPHPVKCRHPEVSHRTRRQLELNFTHII